MIVDTSVKIQPILWHYLKLSVKAAEIAHRFQEMRRDIKTYERTVQNMHK